MTPGVLYVYYKVDIAQHAALAPRVRAFQAALCARWPGLQCELLQRPEASAGVETWMETYRDPDRFGAALVSEIAQAAAAAELPMPRHGETFVPLR